MDEDDMIDLDTGKCFHKQAVPSLKLPTGGCLTHSICPPAPHCPRQPPPRRRRRPGGWHLSFRRQAVNMLRSLVKILGLTDFSIREHLFYAGIFVSMSIIVILCFVLVNTKTTITNSNTSDSNMMLTQQRQSVAQLTIFDSGKTFTDLSKGSFPKWSAKNIWNFPLFMILRWYK